MAVDLNPMGEIREFKQKGCVLARHIPAELAWQPGLNFFSADEEYLQVGSWGYSQGKQLLPHAHNVVPREVPLTQEVLYIRKGKIKASIYDSDDVLCAEWEVGAGDILILLGGGHGYEILEGETQVLEIKNGPYVGADADRRRL